MTTQSWRTPLHSLILWLHAAWQEVAHHRSPRPLARRFYDPADQGNVVVQPWDIDYRAFLWMIEITADHYFLR